MLSGHQTKHNNKYGAKKKFKFHKEPRKANTNGRLVKNAVSVYILDISIWKLDQQYSYFSFNCMEKGCYLLLCFWAIQRWRNIISRSNCTLSITQMEKFQQISFCCDLHIKCDDLQFRFVWGPWLFAYEQKSMQSIGHSKWLNDLIMWKTEMIGFSFYLFLSLFRTQFSASHWHNDSVDLTEACTSMWCIVVMCDWLCF